MSLGLNKQEDRKSKRQWQRNSDSLHDVVVRSQDLLQVALSDAQPLLSQSVAQLLRCHLIPLRRTFALGTPTVISSFRCFIQIVRGTRARRSVASCISHGPVGSLHEKRTHRSTDEVGVSRYLWRDQASPLSSLLRSSLVALRFSDFFFFQPSNSMFSRYC